MPAGVSAPGAVMPDADLLDVHGATTSLAQARAGRPAVVVFYRGAWCPYCNIALRTYQAELAPALEDRGYAMIAVSPQKPDGSLTAGQTNELTYTVVSDPGNQIASALGILTAPSADAVAAQQKLGLDLAEHNADGGLTLPMPTTVVVDATGVIRLDRRAPQLHDPQRGARHPGRSRLSPLTYIVCREPAYPPWCNTEKGSWCKTEKGSWWRTENGPWWV